MTPSRLPFIDWMKCLGMLVIVYGHTVSLQDGNQTFPFFPKQLGVAFFIFIMGFSLAQDKRHPLRVLYNRLFDMYFFGVLMALFMSGCMMIRKGDPNESNYLPFLLGANVLFNNFPANPTTWFIGTYLHLLLLWFALTRRFRVRLWMVLACMMVEIPLRALLMSMCGEFIAYMLITNWISVFLLGAWIGALPKDVTPLAPLSICLIGLGMLLFLWPMCVEHLSVADGFPFRHVVLPHPAGTAIATSGLVSALYLAYTWLGFQITQRFENSRVVQFFARNTVFVFIAHMPLYYGLRPILHSHLPWPAARVIVDIAIYYVALTCVSEVLRRVLKPELVRDWLAGVVDGRMRRRTAIS